MVTLLIAGSVVVFGFIFIASINHHHKQKSFLEKSLNVDDEIEAMTKLGYKVKIVKSSPRNIKLTYQDDVKVIKDLMKKI